MNKGARLNFHIALIPPQEMYLIHLCEFVWDAGDDVDCGVEGNLSQCK